MFALLLMTTMSGDTVTTKILLACYGTAHGTYAVTVPLYVNQQ